MKEYPVLCLKIAYWGSQEYTYYNTSHAKYTDIESAKADLDTVHCKVIRLIKEIPELIKDTDE